MAVRGTRVGVAWLLACAAGALMNPASALAFAQEGALDHTFGTLQPANYVVVQLEATRFNLPGGSGQFTTQALNAQYAPFPFLAFRARIPSHFLSLATAPVQFGIGDMELGAKLRVLGTDYLYSVTLGTDLDLPTGDAARGLGSGSISVVPYLTAGVTLDAFNVGLTFGGRVNADNKSDPAIDFVTPHARRELFSQLLVTYSINLRTFAHLGVDTAHPRSGDQRGLALVHALAGAGVWPSENSRVVVNVGFPVAGPHRYEWKVLVSAFFLFTDD